MQTTASLIFSIRQWQHTSIHSLYDATMSTNAVEFQKKGTNMCVFWVLGCQILQQTNCCKTFFLSYFVNNPTFLSANKPWSRWLRCTQIWYICLHMQQCTIPFCSLEYALNGPALQTWMGKCPFPQAHLWKQTCGWGCFFLRKTATR